MIVWLSFSLNYLCSGSFQEVGGGRGAVAEKEFGVDSYDMQWYYLHL